MRYPKPTDRYSCEVLCENFMEVDERLKELEENGGGSGGTNFSGSYNDLTDKPSIPSKTSQLINDKGFLTDVPSEYVTETELTAKGYLTEHQDLSEYATKKELEELSENMSNGGGSAGTNLNLNEVKTNDTFMGKPVYSKTIMFNTTIKDQMYEVNHNISNIEYLWIDMQNTFMMASSGLTFPLVMWRYNRGSASVQVSATKTTVRLDVVDGWDTIWTKVITLRYTKTTD